MKNKPKIKWARDWYESAGMTLIPIAPRGKGKGKAPLIETVNGKPVVWTTHPYKTARVIRQHGKRLNLGYRIDKNVVVLDYDSRAGGCGSIEELEGWLQLDGETLAGTTHVISGGKPDKQGRRGGHIYFRLPKAFDHSATKIKEAIDGLAGIEIKKIGRQVLIAGDVHPETGDYYKPVKGSVPPADMRTIPTPLLKLITAKSVKKDSANVPGEYTAKQLAPLLAKVPAEEFGEGGKFAGEWLEMCMGYCAATGKTDEAKDAFLSWCEQDARYANNADENERRWNSCKPEGETTAATFFGYVSKCGGKRLLAQLGSPERDFDDIEESEVDPLDMDELDMDDERESSSYTDEDELPEDFIYATDKDGDPTDKVLPIRPNLRLALDRMNIELRYDLFACKAVISGMKGYGPFLGDAEADELRFRMHKKFNLYGPEKTFFKTGMETIARRNSFHPVLDYLDDLHWDGKPRLDTWLIKYGGVKDTPFTRAVGAIVLIAACRRVRKPGCKFDELLVLESSEGKNKSTMLEIMAVNKNWFTDSIPLNADSKLMIEATEGKWIGEIAELQGMSDSKMERIKANLSRNTDRARMAFAHFSNDRPRQFVQIGTTNSQEYLSSIYGNRRFWPVEIKKFDLEAIRRDRDQLWAEAAMREADGASIRLDEKLWAAAAREQENRAIEDPFLIRLTDVLGDKKGVIRTEDVWRILDIPVAHQNQNNAGARLGAAMRKLDWHKPNKTGQRRFNGKRMMCYLKGDPLDPSLRTIMLETTPTGKVTGAIYESDDEG